jgi:hypothetical protein
MEYFSSFPKVTESINGNPTTRVDISYATLDDSEDYQGYVKTSKGEKEISLLSVNIYKDANNFWAIMFANDATNPWTLIPLDPYANAVEKSYYSGLFGKYNGATKQDPNAYVTFNSNDILIRGSYSPGATAAKDVFLNYDALSSPIWYVQKAFSDTKKAKVTRNINILPGLSGAIPADQDISNPEVESGSINYVVLRSDGSNYSILPSLGGASGGSSYVSNLSSYSYNDSPAIFNIKYTNDVATPTTSVSADDSILTVIANDSAGSTGIQYFDTNYNTKTTQEVYVENYQTVSQISYILQNNFSKILNKLV